MKFKTVFIVATLIASLLFLGCGSDTSPAVTLPMQVAEQTF